MRISIVSGVCVLPDAISSSIVWKLKVLRECFSVPDDVDYRVFVCDTNVDDERIKVRLSPTDVAMDPFFSSSDIVIYEFGIFTWLFNSIFVLPPRTKKLVVYHNITPEHLARTEDQKRVIRLGLAQKANLKYADHIVADSDYNHLDLIQYGIAPAMITTLNLPMPDGFSPEGACLKSRRSTAELLYVGRFVASKGVLDLIEAVTAAVQSGFTKIRLTLVGDTEFSDPTYITEVRHRIAASGLEKHFNFVGAVSQGQLIEHYRDADIFIIPSYHEGYCLPVLEALCHGCLVIAYDAGNLPFITHGLGRLVPVGDIQALSSTIINVAECVLSSPGSPHRLFRVDCGTLTADEYLDRCRKYTSQFTFDRYATQFAKLLRDLSA